MEQICTCCNNSYDLDDFDPKLTIPKKMAEHEICFQCAFWLVKHNEDEKFEENFDKMNPYLGQENIMPLVFEGSHWSFPIKNAIIGICNNNGIFHRLPYMKYFLRFDGFLIATNNLWHQGEIPDRFIDLFPGNCIMLSYPQYLEVYQILKKIGTYSLPKDEVAKFIEKFS